VEQKIVDEIALKTLKGLDRLIANRCDKNSDGRLSLEEISIYTKAKQTLNTKEQTFEVDGQLYEYKKEGKYFISNPKESFWDKSLTFFKNLWHNISPEKEEKSVKPASAKSSPEKKASVKKKMHRICRRKRLHFSLIWFAIFQPTTG